MRFQRTASPLVLLVLASFAASATIPQNSKDESLAAPVPDSKLDRTVPLAGSAKGVSTIKPDVGTKDAPVDGLDGKPHAGPWVAVDADSKKPAAGAEDLVPVKKPAPTLLAKLQESVKAQHSSEDGWSLIPEKNDGVMDDTNRIAPKKGTTGTEGGVSEKSKAEKASELKSGEKLEKKPDSPKEARPLPHSEQENIKEKDAQTAKAKGKEGVDGTAQNAKPKGAVGLEKPTDLPEAPHDNAPPSYKTGSDQSGPDPHIEDTSSGRSSLLKDTMPYTEGTKSASSAASEAEGIIQPFHSYILSFIMIICSEIGDKTFLVAALMAMRHDRMVVFSAAFSALITMTILSAVLGHAVPTLLPKRFVAFAAAILFLVFGVKMLREGLAMPKDSGVGEEMKEVEAELEEKEHQARKNNRRRSSVSPYVLESGRGRRSASRGGATLPAPPQSPPASDDERSPSPSKKASIGNMLGGLNNLFSLVLSPAWVQTFIMTFLGEWGDRSQIATIAMAAGQDYWWVTAGAISGHGICTGIAVIGGRALAGRVSLRVVTLGGAIAFLVFGVIYLFESTYSQSAAAV